MARICLTNKNYILRKTISIILVSVLILLLPSAVEPGNGGHLTAKARPSYIKATFDLSCMFQKQYLAPRAGATFTVFSIRASNIEDTIGTLSLSTKCTSNLFTARVFPCRLQLRGRDGSASALVFVWCSSDTPEGTECRIRVTARRGTEKHWLWLKVTALSSRPRLERSQGELLTGQGYRDPELKPFTGNPLTWELSASNEGFAEDAFPLSYSADFPCAVKFTDSSGNEIDHVRIKGLTRNLLFPHKVHLKASVFPLVDLPENSFFNVTFKLGPGGYTGEVSSVTVRLFNPGTLFCVNDLGGLRPHAHQVLPGAKTTYLLHVTNLEESPIDIALSVRDGAPGWRITISPSTISGLAPGTTAQSTVEVAPPEGASPGSRLDFEVDAATSSGKTDRVRLAAEVTSTPKVYFWSVDSLNPEYLYLNRAGTAPGSEGDWLMPNIRSFLSECVNYRKARCYLPAATDMNHTNALAGTYSGTAGIYLVGGCVKGFNEYGEMIQGPNTVDLMRYGPEGKPIERIFEVAKRETGGKSLCGFWSNKNWLAQLEGERSVDIVGTSEKFPLFFKPPYKHVAGDPQSDEDPSDPLSGPFAMCFYSDITRELIIPTLLGQFSVILGIGMFIMPVSIYIGMLPGDHCEDAYLVESFFRSIIEEDPDISYINIADLDNTGHFTGASWDLSEWDTRGTPGAADDESKLTPWARRDECLDICREADILFGKFIRLLKDRGVFDSSIIVFLSDHGMENAKDKQKGYKIIDVREILRSEGILICEDYHEAAGGLGSIWVHDTSKTSAIEQILEGYEVDDPDLGTIRPLVVINRDEMKNGVNLGPFGRIRPMELYSRFWIEVAGPGESQVWADLFVIPLYNYNIASHGQALTGGFNPIGISLGNFPDSMQIGFPANHGGPTTADIPLLFKPPLGTPGYVPGTETYSEAAIGDIAPTIYRILGWATPECVDGRPLPETARTSRASKRKAPLLKKAKR